MEKLIILKTYLFNTDFEQQLFSEAKICYESNKVNQEFEYLLHWLDPEITIYTRKIYQKSYLRYIKEKTGFELKTTQKPNNVKLWNPYEGDMELLKKLQNKNRLLIRLKEQKLIGYPLKEVKKKSELRESFLYRYHKSFSGQGNFIYPKDERKICNLLKLNEKLLEVPLLERVMDFSTLIYGKKILSIYENDVDKYFQYKGSLIGKHNLVFLQSHQKKYERSLSFILESYLGNYSNYASIDGFLYKYDDEVHMQPACEINVRKTMGHFAFVFKEKFFPDINYLKFKLIKNKCSNKLGDKIFFNLPEDIILLSPLNNSFLSFIILGDSKSDILKKEDDLSSRLFKGF